MQIKLRDYQKKDIQIMVQRKRIINANEPGLGKTLECLYARHVMQSSYTLIISPKIATGVWEHEAKSWFNWDSTILFGTKTKREQIWDNWDTDILITNFAMVEEVLQHRQQWDLIIIDEAHLGGLLNHKSKTFKLIKQLKSCSMFILTGTPVRRGPQDLYSLLHLLWPSKFSSYWKFINKYCIINETPFGKEIMGRPLNPTEFKAMLNNFLIRNDKKKVLKDLPEKIRSIVPIEITNKQKKYYDTLVKEMILETEDTFIVSQNAMINVLRLRQLLVCPKILGIDDYGSSLTNLVTDLIPTEFDNGRSVVVCTPFRQAIPFIRELIAKELPNVDVFEIHGDIKEPANDIALRFQTLRKVTKVLIYTIKSGASWTATSASTAFFLGAEWSNIDNLQAEDRIHRISQTNLVQVKYLLVKNTVDDILKDRLSSRNLSSQWTLNPSEVYSRIRKNK